MRFRLGIGAGFAAGYYLGSMAGRERYEQINQAIAKVKGSDAYEAATEKVQAAVDHGVDRAREVVEDRFGRDDSPEDAAAVAARTGNGSSVNNPPPPWPDTRP